MSEYDAQSVSIVDDDGSLRRSVRNLLTSVGFRVETLVSAEAFLESVHRTNTGSPPGSRCYDVGARCLAAMRYLFRKNGADHSMTNPTGRRRAIVAFFLSGVFPGLGQFYNRQPLKGGALLVAGGALSWLIGRMVPTDLMALASGSVGTDAILLLCLLLAIWLWSVIDAWRVGMR